MPRYPYIVYPEYFVCRGGGGDSFLFIKKKTTTTVIRTFNLLYWYSYIVYPEYFVCRGEEIASSSLKKKLLLL